MSKRSNPFVEDFVPQSKTHVGLKQFNNNKDRMKKVYEKTLELLFKGARKSQAEGIKSVDAVLLNKKDSRKQLLINKDGFLISSKIPIELGNNTPVKKCGCTNSVMETQCAYCEASLCSSCHHLCVRCNLPFCSNCCLTGSEGTEVCVSCYG